MITIDQLKIGEKSIMGLKVELPQAPILLLGWQEIMIGCGYFDIRAMEELDQVACTVSGVNSLEDVLNAEIKEATSEAFKRGAKEGMIVRRFIGSL